MNADLRQRVRQAIDKQARERMAAFADAGELLTCIRCGGDRTHTTRGCKACWDRARRRRVRDNPVMREQEQAKQRKYRRQRAEAQRARRLALQGRPAGAAPEVVSPGKSPVGRRPPVLPSVLADNRL